MSESSLSDFFNDHDFVDTNLAGDDLFSILESLDGLTDQLPTAACSNESNTISPKESDILDTTKLGSQKSSSSIALLDSETELESCMSPKSKKQKVMGAAAAAAEDANPRMSHITVERNRRKQMNEHLSVLRTLMPSFYVKRGDQASIIGGVVDYINELQTVLQSLEAKKQRKIYNEVLSPRPSPRPTSQLSPRKPPLSPRLINLPISPRTPQPGSPYRPRLQSSAGYISPTIASPLEPSPSPSSTSSSIDSVNELVANSKSQIADVEVKFSGPNLLLKTVSPRIPGQAMKIISALEELALEILQVNINTLDHDTLLNSFTIKIGIECQLSAEELAQQIQKTFSYVR